MEKIKKIISEIADKISKFIFRFFSFIGKFVK
jgi:hypothetical protein